LRRAQSVVSDQRIINVLINLLQNDDPYTKSEVLSFISDVNISNPSAALITAVTLTLADKEENVRSGACEVLRRIGEKAATTEVITKLVSAVADESERVRRSACEALGKIGEKAATTEVIKKLTTMGGIYERLSYLAACTIDSILSSSTLIIGLGPKLILKLCLSKSEFKCLKNVSVIELIRKFIITENVDWLSVVICITYLKGAAMSVNENTLVVYDKREPSELHISSLKLRQEIIEAFNNYAKQLHLCFEIPLTVQDKR
jgi:hypothetical protein